MTSPTTASAAAPDFVTTQYLNHSRPLKYILTLTTPPSFHHYAVASDIACCRCNRHLPHHEQPRTSVRMDTSSGAAASAACRHIPPPRLLSASEPDRFRNQVNPLDGKSFLDPLQVRNDENVVFARYLVAF